MKGGYPPGTSHRDLVRAGIIEPDPLPCPECDAQLRECVPSEHEDWCPDKEITAEKVAEIEAERRTPSYDDIREERQDV